MNLKKRIKNPKRITVNLPEVEWKIARQKAAERGMTFSGLVVKFIRDKFSTDLAAYRAARKDGKKERAA